ncbi:MAG TPA: hypothetical protein VEI74_00900 [Candidatus Methylomirabilis sp.]|nr:hypothetical protein [Candidatus Methylomirabilis sp.]
MREFDWWNESRARRGADFAGYLRHLSRFTPSFAVIFPIEDIVHAKPLFVQHKELIKQDRGNLAKINRRSTQYSIQGETKAFPTAAAVAR